MKRSIGLSLLLIASLSVGAHAQSGEGQSSEDSVALVAKRLGSRDALVRQSAAEELAQLAAADQRKMLEGYRLQEKNARVKLALDWALYRIGKSEALFAVVRALDSPRADQAASYLNTLESADPLFLFLESANGNTQVKLLEILAKIGDTGSLDKVRPYEQSFDPKVSAAARQAVRDIEARAEAPRGDTSTRPRRAVEGEEETSP